MVICSSSSQEWVYLHFQDHILVLICQSTVDIVYELILCRGTILCSAGYAAASLASTHWTPLAPFPQAVTTKKWVQTLLQGSSVAKSPLAENHCASLMVHKFLDPSTYSRKKFNCLWAPFLIKNENYCIKPSLKVYNNMFLKFRILNYEWVQEHQWEKSVCIN